MGLQQGKTVRMAAIFGSKRLKSIHFSLATRYFDIPAFALQGFQYGLTLVALQLQYTIFDGAANAAGFLQFFVQSFQFGASQWYAGYQCDASTLATLGLALDTYFAITRRRLFAARAFMSRFAAIRA